MISPALVMFTSNLAQATGAVALATLLVSFHRHYQRSYLRTWAWSWWAFCISLVGASVAQYVSLQMPPAAAARSLASSVSLIGGYWQVAWLLFGTREVLTGRRSPRRLELGVLAALLALALGTVFGSLLLASQTRLLVRVGIKGLALGGALLGAGWGLWRRGARPAGLGRRLVAGGFVLFGLHQVHYLVLLVGPVLGLRLPSYGVYLMPFDFLFQVLIGIGMVIWLLEDERQRVVATSARIEHLAYHDALTDLPNRNLLLRYLQESIARAQTRREGLAVLFLDLDRFKVVNDSLGNRAGDELLKALAERFRSHLRGTDLVARLAADEFAILVPVVETEAAVSRVAEKLLAATRLPLFLQGREIYLTASLGVSRCPEDGVDAEALLKRAEIAMYRAKETRRDGYQLYVPGMDANSLEQLSLETDLRKALAKDYGELTLFYQPIFDSLQHTVTGVEALIRWNHPRRGLLPPGEFLWLAEVAGLAGALDGWVLRTACREVQEWRDHGAAGLQVHVNLSARTFQQTDLPEQVRGVLAATGLPPSCLVLEITETLAMQNAEATLAVLRGLKELGVKIAIDDFGTGYSSLSYLTTFPIDTLKVDRSFVHALGKERGGEEVAAAVIALAVSLEIGVIGEGVEDREQWLWLRALGCDRFQGFLFSHPLPADECRYLVLHGNAESRPAPAERLLAPAS